MPSLNNSDTSLLLMTDWMFITVLLPIIWANGLWLYDWIPFFALCDAIIFVMAILLLSKPEHNLPDFKQEVR